MGTIYALCGPSGVGKTTFMGALREASPAHFRFVPRVTTRPRRPDEETGFEYYFCSEEAFFRKLFSGDLVFPEIYDGHMYGLDRMPILEALESTDDAIVMAGILGATRLKELYPNDVEVIYMYTADRSQLLSPETIRIDYPPSALLADRLARKIHDGHFGAKIRNIVRSVRSRMRLNYVDISFVNGEIRRNSHRVFVLDNAEDEMATTLSKFAEFRKSTSKYFKNVRIAPR